MNIERIISEGSWNSRKKTEQALSAKKIKEMKKAEKRKQKEAKRNRRQRTQAKSVKSTCYYCGYHNCTDRDTHGKLCVFRQCWSDGKHH